MNWPFLVLLVLLLQSSLSSASHVFYSDKIKKTYPIESNQLKDYAVKSGKSENQAVVVGAGIAGLMSALELAEEGYDVVVLEKRSGNFSRLNMVNLKVESEAGL